MNDVTLSNGTVITHLATWGGAAEARVLGDNREMTWEEWLEYCEGRVLVRDVWGIPR